MMSGYTDPVVVGNVRGRLSCGADVVMWTGDWRSGPGDSSRAGPSRRGNGLDSRGTRTGESGWYQRSEGVVCYPW